MNGVTKAYSCEEIAFQLANGGILPPRIYYDSDRLKNGLSMRTKTWVTLMVMGMCLGITTPLRAQLFSPESFTGAAFGALTGAIVGGHHHAGTGAAIGAGAGFLLGTIAHESNRRYYEPGYYGYSAAPYYGPYAYPQTYAVTTHAGSASRGGGHTGIGSAASAPKSTVQPDEQRECAVWTMRNDGMFFADRTQL